MSGEAIEQALRLAAFQVLPVALAAGGAALIVGVLAHRFGLNDPTLLLVARAAAVLAVLARGGAAWLAETASWTGGLWSRIAEIGHGAPPP